MKNRFLLACAISLATLASSYAQQSTTHTTTDARTGVKVTTISTPLPTETPFTVASVKQEIAELDAEIAKVKAAPNTPSNQDLLKKYEQKRLAKKEQLKALEAAHKQKHQ